MQKSNRIFLGILLIIVVSAIGLTLFQHKEYSSDVWGYWFFARIFAETGKFIIIDRSPLYILYLSFFRLIPHPFSLYIEYFVTTLIVVLSLIVFFRSYMGWVYATFISVLWIPFMQLAEPPVQKLALACTLWAFIFRKRNSQRFYIAISYTLLMGAYLFRSSYFYYLVFFLVWDLVVLFKKHKYKSIRFLRPHIRTDWPLGIVLIMYLFFVILQSLHPWNNVWFATTKWFPADGKHFTIHQPFNILYTREKYGPDFGHDFYFTNQEVFHGASDNLSAFAANPSFIIRHAGLNILRSIPVIANMTLLPLGIPNGPVKEFMELVIIAAVIFGAYKSSNERLMMPFVTANLLLIIIAVLLDIHPRYLFPLIPILSLSGWWYGRCICQILSDGSGKIHPNLFIILRPFLSIIPIVFILLFTVSSNNYQNIFGSQNLWLQITATLANDIRQDDIHMLTYRYAESPVSMTVSLAQIAKEVKNCKGILSYESQYLADFTDIPINRFYDIWEIPPFGHLGDSVYNGLTPSRVDCVLVSYDLEKALGSGTNAMMRYEAYIKPYVQELVKLGASVITIDHYGNLYRLNHESKGYEKDM